MQGSLGARRKVWFALLVLALPVLPGALFAQTGDIVGMVTHADTGEPVSAVQISVAGLNIGAVSATNGTYTIANVPAGTHSIAAQRLGFQQLTQSGITVTAGGQTTVNLVLRPQVLALQGVVATGLVDPVEGARSPITVGRVTRDMMPVPTVGSPLQNLAGLVPGVAISQTSGQPGSEATIMLRTPTSATQEGRPMIVVDGVILGGDGSSIDIDGMDVESIEIIKGAAAASLYGSRAAAGVIAITTARGQGLELGQTRFSARSEIGWSTLAGTIRSPTHHQYLVDDPVNPTTYVDWDGNPVDRTGRVAPPPSMAFMDTPYPGRTYDQMSRIFGGGLFNTTNFSVSQNTADTNFSISLNRMQEEGTLLNNDGYSRTGLRANLDHRFLDNVTLGISLYHSRDYRDLLSTSPTFARRAPPDVDLLRQVDGQYIQVPDPLVPFENPLWVEGSRDNEQWGVRTLSSAQLNWDPLFWLSVSGNVSYDRRDSRTRLYVPRGTPTSITQDIPSLGQMTVTNDGGETWNAEAQLSLRRDFGLLNVRTTGRAILERDQALSAQASGTDFFVTGVPRINMAANRTATSSNEEIRSLGYLVDTAFDYDGKYILTALARTDGSSLFGPDNRWHDYYRVAGAWRIGEEVWFNVPRLTEFKLRFAQGTAGGRPQFAYQFETWNVTAAGASKATLGNANLRPEHTTEREITLEMIVDDRIGFELTYAHQTTDDQLVPLPLPAVAGYVEQWTNVGQVVGSTWEARLEAQLLSTPTAAWTTMLTFDRPRSRITEWGAICQNVAWRWRCDDTGLFEIWGGLWVRQLDHLDAFHQGGALAAQKSEFQVNDDGYVVWIGEGRHYTDALWGTSTVIGGVPYEWGIPFERLVEGGAGSRDQIGDGAYMNFGWLNTVRLGAATISAHLHASIGGELASDLWGLEPFNTHPWMDQAPKPEEFKKPVRYYEVLRSNRGNSQNVGPADFLKLRSLAVNYRLSQNLLQRVALGGIFDSMTLGVVGHNLININRCDCIDPEQGRNLATRAGAAGSAVYPSSRTFTMELGVTF